MSETLRITKNDHRAAAPAVLAPSAAPQALPPYAPPAIELRMPLETTAAFCDTAMNGKEFPLCTGPINS
jgi:hypothetical protein